MSVLTVDRIHLIKMITLASIVGILTGILGSLFQLGIDWMSDGRIGFIRSLPYAEYWGWLISMILSAVMVFLSVEMVRRFAPEAGGSGVQEMEGALEDRREIRWRRVIPVKFFGGLLSLGGGMVMGREGPTIQMGGSFGKMVSDIFKLEKDDFHVLVSAGAGAGLAAAFNAPLAGILFVIEEMRKQFKYNYISMTSVITACIFSVIVLRIFMGQGNDIPMQHFPAPKLDSLWIFIVFGAVFGVIGKFFNRALLNASDTIQGLEGLKYKYFSLVFGAVVGLLLWFWPEAVGGGYLVIPEALDMKFAAGSLLLIFVVRFVMTALSYGTGAPGGIFAPMLALGTVFGMWFGHTAQDLFPSLVMHPGVYAVAGMSALFTATVRAPLTGIVLVVEMTENYALILPLIITCVVAAVVASELNGRPIYSVLLERTLKISQMGRAYFKSKDRF